MSTLLSIIVPTRDRADTAFPCIRQLLAIPDADIEVVVRDCSNSDELERLVATIEDERLVYQRGPSVSMTDNWNAAYALSSGRYVCYIGDDDGFVPSGVGIVRELAAQGAEAIAYVNNLFTYYWPNFPDPAWAGKLFYTVTDMGRPVVKRSRQLLIDFFTSNDATPKPMAYQGIVSRQAMDRAAAIAGDMFQALAPDTFLSGILCHLDIEVTVIGMALTVNGKSGKSNSGIYVKGAHAQRVAHTGEFTKAQRRLHPLMPPVDAIETLVGDSYLRAITIARDDGLLKAFMGRYLGSIYAEATLRQPRLAGRIVKGFWAGAYRFDRRALNARMAAGAALQAFKLGTSRLRKAARGGAAPRDPDPRARVAPAQDIIEAIGLIEQSRAAA